MDYYGNVSRETFQTPCQLLASLLQPGPSTDVSMVTPPSPENTKNQDEVRRNETLRQARRRFVAESVGFEPTAPYVAFLEVPNTTVYAW